MPSPVNQVPNIHTLLLRRLLVTAIVLSALIGTGMLFWMMEQVDERVLSLARQESERLTAPYLRNAELDAERLREQEDSLYSPVFPILEIYDARRHKLAESRHPDAAALEPELHRFAHSFPHDGEPHYERLELAGHTHLRVILPLARGAAGPIGYFEGVYRVAPEVLVEIRSDLARTLASVVFAVFATALVLYPVVMRLNRGLIQLSADLLRGNLELMEVLGGAIAKRDSDTHAHNYRVTLYAIALAEKLAVDAGEIRNLIAGAFLHDVGKIGISDNILLKPGRLTEEEFAIMRTHVVIGRDILAKSRWLESALDVVTGHHEKFDGSGYPQGLKDEAIPLNARIFAIVDVFDALTSRRPYKEPMTLEESLAIMGRDCGQHFDPAIFAAFREIAASLHQKFAALGEDDLATELEQRMARYFFAGAGTVLTE